MGVVLHHTATPATPDLLNVFETFLPQLLLYPNPTDPLNGEAAALLMREPDSYHKKVRGADKHNMLPHSGHLTAPATDYVQRFAKPEDIDRAGACAPAEEEHGDKSEDGFLSSSDDDDDGGEMDL